VLSDYITKRSAIGYSSEEIIITPGGKFAVYASLQAVVNRGDEVLVLEPGWVSYAPCVSLAGGIPIGVNCLKGIDLQNLDRAITPKTKAIIVNTPVNPTGRIITLRELEIISGIAQKYNLWVISDEVYAELIYEPHTHISIASLKGMKERTFLVDSFSKTFGMTGWRLGCLALPEKYVRSILKTIQHSIYCVPPFIQTAALKAFELYPTIIAEIRKSFQERVNFAYNKLIVLPGVTCSKPVATFYLFPNIQRDDMEFARQ
jgi:aspartate aminotransferase